MKKHLLLIMRHAKSDWSDHAAADFDRMLTDRGRKDAKKMGTWLRKKKIIPDSIVSSPAARAERTALIVCKETGFDPAEIMWDRRIYEASREDLLKVVAGHAQNNGCMLLIGHNPGLEELLSYLSGDQPEANETGKMLTTAAIAVLDYGKQAINHKKASARLVRLVRPRD
ncbi:MAG: SixA phosphatase family protein [Gammaproteobacteria bacterium]